MRKDKNEDGKWLNKEITGGLNFYTVSFVSMPIWRQLTLL
jgi:hypothetical protein